MDEISLSNIKAFIETVKHGSLTKAANILHLTNAAISKKLTQLESQLKVLLIKRHKSGVELTEIGIIYYQEWLQILDQISQLNHYVVNYTGKPHGDLKIHCVKANWDKYIMPYLSTFITRYPDIHLIVSSTESIPDVASGEVDLLWGLALPVFNNSSELIRKVVGYTRQAICVAPDYFRQNPITTPNDLFELCYLAHSVVELEQQLQFDDQQVLTLQPSIILDNNQKLIDSAIAGMGFIIIKEYLVEEYLAKGLLVKVLADYLTREFAICAYYRYQKFCDAKLRVFLEHFTNTPEVS